MKDQVLKLIQDYPKQYTQMIRSRPKLYEWVMAESTAVSDRLVDHVKSAAYGITNICKYGNKKKFTYNGLANCGPASICKCTREQITENTKKTKSKVTAKQQKQINEKREKTTRARYGYGYSFQRPEVKEKISKCKLPIDAEEYLKNKEWLYQRYVIEQMPSTIIAEELGVYYSTVIDYCKQYNFKIRKTNGKTSVVEKQITDYLNSLGVAYQTNDRNLISPRELDIIIPERRLAIEVNGLYWHSYHPNVHVRDKKLIHLEKTLATFNCGYELFHITDWQWKHKTDIIKSMLSIKTHTGVNKIHGRKCTIKTINASEARGFFDKCHLKGFKGAKVHYGLYYENELVMVMSFSKRDNKLHIERMASKLYTSVHGGASKIIKHASKELASDEIFTYCDRNHSSGNSYIQMGFELIGETGIDYFWTNGVDVISRQQAQHHNLKKWLPNYDPTLTENENMFNNRYRIYYGCGSLKFYKKMEKVHTDELTNIRTDSIIS